MALRFVTSPGRPDPIKVVKNNNNVGITYCNCMWGNFHWNYLELPCWSFWFKGFFFVINSQGKWGSTLILDNIISRGQNLWSSRYLLSTATAYGGRFEMVFFDCIKIWKVSGKCVQDIIGRHLKLCEYVIPVASATLLKESKDFLYNYVTDSLDKSM